MAKLTKGERDLVRAVRHGLHGIFHKSIVERCERKGLIYFTGGMRLVGCNSFAASKFAITQAGFEADLHREAGTQQLAYEARLRRRPALGQAVA